MAKEIELVTTHCEHEDCKYRGKLGEVPFCGYILANKGKRGCKISECDKYEPGEWRIRSTLGGFWVD